MELINPIYLQEDTIKQLREHFNQDPEFRSVTLSQFFTRDGLEKILNEVMKTEFKRDDNEIIHRRQVAKLTSTLEKLVKSESLMGLLSDIANTNFSQFSGKIYKFGHRDYKIIHDEGILPPGYDLIIDLTPEWDDELGGYVTYTDGEGSFHSIPSNFGSLTLVERNEDYHYFIKYVNHYAENLNRYLIITDTEVER